MGQKVEDGMYLGTDAFVYDMRMTHGFTDLNGVMMSYLNRPDVMKALNAFPHKWVQFDGGMPGNIVGDLLWQSQIDDLPAGMLESLIVNYKALFYAGNMDLSSCNPLGVSRVLNGLQFPGANEFQQAPKCVWRVDGRGVGVTKIGGG